MGKEIKESQFLFMGLDKNIDLLKINTVKSFGKQMKIEWNGKKGKFFFFFFQNLWEMDGEESVRERVYFSKLLLDPSI